MKKKKSKQTNPSTFFIIIIFLMKFKWDFLYFSFLLPALSLDPAEKGLSLLFLLTPMKYLCTVIRSPQSLLFPRPVSALSASSHM